MRTSRCAIFHAAGQSMTWETVSVGPLRTGEILVRNEYTTLCRSDLNTYIGKRVEKTPTILGHEIVGRIEELGPDAPTADIRGVPLRVGDRVTWAIYASDPASPLSRAGIPQKGAGLFKYGHEPITGASHLHGGLAEYCVLRRHTPIIRIREPIPLPILALLNCSVATVAGSMRLTGGVEGRTVVVAGAGMLGVFACAMSRVAGAHTVLAVDVDDARLAVVRRFGADHTLRLTSMAGGLKAAVEALGLEAPVTVALDFSGVPETMEALVSALGIGGTLVLVGATFPQRDLRVNAEQMVRNLHTVRGLHNYNQEDFLRAVEFVERHHTRFPWAELVEDRFELSQVNEAFRHAATCGIHRVGIRIPSPPGSSESLVAES